MIAKLKKIHLSASFECTCGCIHWLEYRFIKRGYEIECYCGNVLEVPPTNITTSLDTSTSTSPIEKILIKQGFDAIAVGKILPQLKSIKEEDRLREALSLL